MSSHRLLRKGWATRDSPGSALESDPPLVTAFLALGHEPHMVSSFLFDLTRHLGVRNQEGPLHAVFAQELLSSLIFAILDPVNLASHQTSFCVS
jgi:hypothetical protein